MIKDGETTTKYDNTNIKQHLIVNTDYEQLKRYSDMLIHLFLQHWVAKGEQHSHTKHFFI